MSKDNFMDYKESNNTFTYKVFYYHQWYEMKKHGISKHFLKTIEIK